MANYFLILDPVEDKAYAFKVMFSSYQPVVHRNQKEQFTVTGKLDVQIGPNIRTWQMAVKLFGDDSGNFSISSGSKVNKTTAYWGDLDDLKRLFGYTTPPNNKLAFRDFDGDEYYVYFSGQMSDNTLTPILGDDGYHRVTIALKESVE